MSEPTESPSKPKPSFIILPGASFVYASGAYVGETQYDFRLLFYNERVEPTGQKQELGTPVNVIRQIFSEVVLPPQAAEELCKSLGERISKYKRKLEKQSNE